MASPLTKGAPELVGDELDEVGLPHPGGTDEDDVVLDGPHPGFGFPPLLQVMADAVEVGADLGGEDALGVFLLDDVLAEVGLQLFGLQVEVDLVERLGAFAPGAGLGLGHPIRRRHLNTAAVFFGEIIADFFFQLFLAGYLVHVLRVCRVRENSGVSLSIATLPRPRKAPEPSPLDDSLELVYFDAHLTRPEFSAT